MGDDSVEEIMNRVRENNIAERVKRREDMYSKQRKLVAELSHSNITDELKEKEIIKAATMIVTRTRGKHGPFTILKNAFIQSPCHMVTFMKVEGALNALARHLTCRQPTLQLLAAECCCNLSLGDSKTCFKLAKAATPYLITILNGQNENLMNVVLLTISNLTGSGDKTCELLHSQGVLPALQNILAVEGLREQVIKTIIMFSKNASNYMSEAEVQEMVTEILPYFESSNKVQWLIYLLSSHSHVIPVLIEQKMPMRVLTMISGLRRLRADNIISVTSLVRMLGNLSSDPNGITACVMLDNWNMTYRMIKFFLASKYRHLCKEVYWSLGNMLQHKSPEVQKKLSSRSRDLPWLGYRFSPPAT